MKFDDLRVGFAMTGSFCTFAAAFAAAERLAALGCQLTGIMSPAAAGLDTRFGTAADNRRRLESITGKPVILTIPEAEPIGPKKMFDILVVAPCTGNTAAKLAEGVVDTSVTMSVKSHLRSRRPVVLAVSTNDALAAAARNIGALSARKHFYFVPMRQDDVENKPFSLVADLSLLPDTIEAALNEVQLQPTFIL